MSAPATIIGEQVLLPWPAKPLWPNFRSRSHWPKTKATSAARSDAAIVARAARLAVAAGDVPVVLATTFHPLPSGPAPDRDNCMSAMKAYFDGIADALGVNDRLFRHAEPVIGERVRGGAVVVALR